MGPGLRTVHDLFWDVFDRFWTKNRSKLRVGRAPWVEIGSKEPWKAPRRQQMTPRWRQDEPKHPQAAPRCPRDGSTSAPSGPKMPRRGRMTVDMAPPKLRNRSRKAPQMGPEGHAGCSHHFRTFFKRFSIVFSLNLQPKTCRNHALVLRNSK